jgi:hypothetical protein
MTLLEISLNFEDVNKFVITSINHKLRFSANIHLAIKGV